MDASPRLALPCMLPNQTQKHVTHNEALQRLVALVQLIVQERNLTALPPAPEEGRCWVVVPRASGDWADHEGRIPTWQDGAWTFVAPQTGWRAFIADKGLICVWSGSVWSEMLHNLSRLGIGKEADATNPFSAKLNKALWTAKYYAEGGDGNLHYTLNKEAPGKNLFLRMQTDWSGRSKSA